MSTVNKGWFGVDLDGTLAVYDSWVAPEHIGEPIWEMVERVRGWLAEGRDVRIFTARVCGFVPGYEDLLPEAKVALRAIRSWCKLYLGQELPVTCVKDLSMVELWDDRVVQVEMNTGRPLWGERL